ncbi:MAG: toprim domain-containing protein [Rhodocyclaceae bacterium]|nr:toprim domain-containing protein [Rhodocyclaceae bacterium]
MKSRLHNLHARLEGASRMRGDRFRSRCPACGKSSLAVALGRTQLVATCHAGCTLAEVLGALGWRVHDLHPDRAQNAPERTRTLPTEPMVQNIDGWKIDRARAIWTASRPITGTPGADYLLGRGCTLPPVNSDIRFSQSVDLFGLTGPALVGRITRADDASSMRGLHVTWIMNDGTGWKRTERRYLGAKADGVVRLWSDEDVDVRVGIAEGIETTLALADTHRPAWATMDAGNLAAFPVLPGIEALTIAADRDKSGTGQRAALACMRRWRAAGKTVCVVAADELGDDLADERGAACA